MSKTLSERIADRMGSRRKPSTSQRNRAAFLALRNEIRPALDDGWSMRAAWETLYAEKRIAFGYDAFTRYARKLIKPPPWAPQTPAPHAITDGADASGQAEKGPVVGSAELPRFHHNPNRDKKELI